MVLDPLSPDLIAYKLTSSATGWIYSLLFLTWQFFRFFQNNRLGFEIYGKMWYKSIVTMILYFSSSLQKLMK